jgi:hypothetical protein
MKRISLSLYIFFILSLSAFSQKSTKSFTVTGKVRAAQTFQYADFKKFSQQGIGDVVITNHKGEVQGTALDMRGILLRDVLATVHLDTDTAKLFSEYYFVCKARDNYKVVYSWNELFNSATGNNVFIVLEKQEKSMADSEDGILMVSATDVNTGRRYVKNLEAIFVGRAE